MSESPHTSWFTDGRKNTAGQPCLLHLAVWFGQLFQYVVVHQLPVWVVGGLTALLAPPDQVSGVDDKLGAPALYVLHDLFGDPVTTFQPKHGAAPTGK